MMECSNNSTLYHYAAVVAELVYEQLQIQAAERSQFRIQPGTCNYDGDTVTKKKLYPALTYEHSIPKSWD